MIELSLPVMLGIFAFAFGCFLVLIKLLGDMYLPMTEEEKKEAEEELRIW